VSALPAVPHTVAACIDGGARQKFRIGIDILFSKVFDYSKVPFPANDAAQAAGFDA
jgi:hypothetical protein